MSIGTRQMLANGRSIDLAAPQAADVDWDAYAEALAKEPRFAGATAGVVYSVAEHLCRGADAISGGDRRIAAYFLLHDFHEAVLKDDTTPKKCAIAEHCRRRFGVLAEHVLAAIAELTDLHDAAIHAAAGLAWPPDPATLATVKAWDAIMLVTEWRDLMRRPVPAHFPFCAPLEATIVPWRWQTAKTALLTRCAVLLPALRDRRDTYAHGKTAREQGGASV